MELYSGNEHYKLYKGNMLDMLDNIKENSIDAVITDPPYELGFMGKSWDSSGIAFQKGTWEKCLKVLKPGGHMLVFGGTRTYHRIACAIEDSGFEIRDTIMWLYGCLSEDTQVLTKRGFLYYNEIEENDEVRIYDIKNGIYKWEKPTRWNVYKVNKDTCYRIKSNSTDQLVSRNHRCIIERNGNLIFEFAENLNNMERVPVLSYNIPYIQEKERNILFPELLWQDENLAKELFKQWQKQEKQEKRTYWREESFLERRGDLQKQERELFSSKNKICKVSTRIYNDGEKRWVCIGTQTSSGNSNRETLNENGVCASHKSQCRGQSNRKLDVICVEQRPQELRKWKTYSTTMATITKQEYSGIIFCPTVSTSCFVARRNNKVFITGNSGFPKGINIGLAVDKKKGIDNTTGNIRIDGKATNSGSGCWNCNDGKCNSMKPQFAEREAQNQWKGYNSALKPSFEPIIIARKPFSGTLVDNVLKNGVGGINIDECRVELEDGYKFKTTNRQSRQDNNVFNSNSCGFDSENNNTASASLLGRYPSNTILTYNNETFDEVCGGLPSSKSTDNIRHNNHSKTSGKGIYGKFNDCDGVGYADSGSNARFYKNCPYEDSDIWDYLEDIEIKRYFYSGKASKRDRDEGLKDFNESQGHSKGNGLDRVCEFCGVSQLTPELCHCEVKSWVAKPRKNVHPAVKPCSLMTYLVRLVTPKGGTILDPFNGSGSTGKAVMRENKERNANYKYIGIEMTDEYLPISKARIEFEIPNCEIRDFNDNSNEIETKVKESQTSIGNKQISMFD